MRYRTTIIGLLILLSTVVAQGQIRIGGNVYGGGNHAEVQGSTKVTVKAGDIGAVMDPNASRPVDDPHGKVFGGARMANVGGNAFVHIDGENATGYILINQVYGGNDIAGQIGTGTVPTELTAVKAADDPDPKKNVVDNSFNSFVRISTKALSTTYTQDEIDAAANDPEAAAYGKRTTDVKPDPTAKKVYIGQLFAGGNGDFDYEQTPAGDNKVTHTIYNRWDKNHTTPLAQVTTDAGEVGFQLPEQDKTYLEILGGSIVYGYGGGNNATVKEQNIIHFDNPSAVVNHIWTDDAGVEVAEGTSGATDLLITQRFKEMGINTTFSQPSSGAYQVGRFFGGNNKAEMDIRPTWNLLAGKVRNLYSGGNRGNMTSPEGLLIEIKDYSSLIVDNLYGGCRMADVVPTVNGIYTPCANLQDIDEEGKLIYHFPNELSARTLVRGGYIHNVYGGNDVTGTVYGGNAVGIYTTVYGDVYGGGNGAYPYTDNPGNKDDDTFGDFYYDRPSSGMTSENALNTFRPNAEQVSIRLKGTDADHPTIIQGSVYLGGNCASLVKPEDEESERNKLFQLKMGSYVIADKVFLGNNGEGMINETYLENYADNDFSSMKLTQASVFKRYMEGVAMPLRPKIVFDGDDDDDTDTYKPNSSYIGSFYCGGNKGSMTASGKTSLKFNKSLVIFEKLVGGCNDANVEAGTYNAAYEGGVLGSSEEQGNYTEGGKIKDRIELDLDNIVIEPRRWNDTFVEITNDDLKDGKLKKDEVYYTTNLRSSRFIADGTETVDLTAGDKYYKLTKIGNKLDWNTALWNTNEDDFLATESSITHNDNDQKRRLLGGNVYGGCYNSGHINGNVVINLNQDLLKRDDVFAEANPKNPYQFMDGGKPNSGVLKETQGDDVMAVALTLFGGGCGEDTEVWGSATVNLNNGYVFQVFGGGEEGVVGKKNSAGKYEYNANYSTTVNLKGPNAGYSEESTGLPLAETEYIYGGGNEGDVCGDSYVYLGNGRVYDAFGGASNADIYGGTEVYVGHNGGFPWIRDNVYGGNDFGGTIKGNRNHTNVTTRSVFDSDMLLSATYVKYIQGRVDSIFGGNYGYYNYADRIFKGYTDANGTPLKDEEGNPIFSFPHLDYNSFVHFVPADNSNSQVKYIFGGSTGFPGNVNLNNAMQEETYVLIDDTQTKDVNRYANVDIYGGGAFAGVGTSTSLGTSLGAGRTAVDLFAGNFRNVYGGCNQEGLVGYTRVNVPSVSTVKVNALFGGGKGYEPALFDIPATAVLAERYCDHYVTCIDYKSKDAIVNDAIYGGNQDSRIACDTYINIEAPVMQSNGYQADIYGAGYGKKTVSGRTNVFMNYGSNAYKVFGGGREGNTFNYASLIPWLTKQFRIAAGNDAADVSAKVTAYGDLLRSFETYLTSNPITLPNHTGTYVNASGEYNGTYTNDILTGDFHQTNVHIMKGGNVSGYAYGGGLGEDAVVAGSTYIELKGGNVDRDIYGGGQGGPVFDEFNLGTSVFTATTNVNIEGGMARNVYGGGYLGHVGKHTKTVNNKEVEADISDDYAADILGVANVTIGKIGGTGFDNGVPAITRNVYGGGEGGSVYGTVNLTINNGYVGYRYKDSQYVEELDDNKPNDIEMAGNVFGGGYVVNSYVDITNIDMYGGKVRGSLYGGGEVGPIGRGTIRYKDTYTNKGLVNGDARIYKAGQTHIKMYNGHVLRNVFGGGRGKDSWGGDGTMYMDKDVVATLDLMCKGYVFGQTDVNIYGGEIGTNEGLADGYGNVFGGGDEGSVYSAYEQNGNLYIGEKPENSVRYDKGDEGYYYKSKGNQTFVDNAGTTLASGDEKFLTEDCHVLIEPWLQVKTPIDYNGHTYQTGEYIPTSYLNTLPKKDKTDTSWPAAWNYVDAGSAVGDEYVERGVIIHNAVFAGGNIAVGSELYANTKTVFGNATASIHDVYNRDLITVGGIHIGGLYGDGNLTFVDGYRELNVTNYGTDYYNIKDEISNETYKALPPREQAYYELKFKCIQPCTDNEGTTYTSGSNIPLDELLVLFEGNSTIIQNGKPNPAYWIENGVVSRYAGRYLNTIQRADFCGIFGSRMVMKGAKDRVPEIEDATNYTINRVREVSLNKKRSVRDDDIATYTAEDEAENPDHKAGTYKNSVAAEHGNYFGIYSVVNYLGALTSDLNFYNDVRTTDNKDHVKYVDPTANGKTYGTATYADWKMQFHKDPRRNNGLSHNEVALASGVHLELTTEESTGNTLETKEWGIITGVVQLDLINVAKGIGGGFVYAKNIHGVRNETGKTNSLLSDLNLTGGPGGTRAITNRKWSYVETDPDVDTKTQQEWQTSGNFVHNTQTIIDDCYNISGRYLIGSRVPAHYWFIRGSVYVYDQYITAQTGAANAYTKNVELPITISAAAHNQMKLLDVQPNLYAYYSKPGTPLSSEQKLVIQDNEYYLNTPISYWDWYLLSATEKNLFVPETYVTSEKCKIGIGSEIIQADLVLLPSEYSSYERAATTQVIDGKSVKAVIKIVQDKDGNDVVAKDKNGNPVYVPFTSVFHSSNEMSHDTGYLLTYKMTNPKLWDTWYTNPESTTHEKSQTTKSWENGPTYYLNTTTGTLLGQHEYKEAEIIPEKTYIDYAGYDANNNGDYTDAGIDANGDGDYDDEGDTKPDIKGLVQTHSSAIPASGQAEFSRAYVITAECSDANRHYYKGAPVSETIGTSTGVSASPAYVCTGTIQLSATEYIFVNDLMTEDEKTAFYNRFKEGASEANAQIAKDISELIVPAYYCTSPGLYGGNYYEANKNYRALEAWSAMSKTDRANFTFNYDAFDLLIDKDYDGAEGQKYQYDSAAGTLAGARGNPAQYSLETPIDYTATYEGTSLDAGKTVHVKHASGTPQEEDVTTIMTGDVLERDVYESLLNEQYHYAPIEVDVSKATKYYVVNTAFYYKEPYAAGQIMDADTYNALPNSTEEDGLNYQRNVDELTFSVNGTYYYCRDSYTIEKGANGGKPVKAVIANGDIAVNSVKNPESTVPVGFVISQDGDDASYTNGYKSLTNRQLGFSIHGVSPMETSTLYVSRDAKFDDLSKEKIITVIYQYDYEESDEEGAHITPISERHVVRIHVTFEDGIPTVEDIREPDIVLPGNSITMRVPGVNSNGYEIIGGGWELFETKEDAESHFSGKEYTPSSEPLYWYQDDFYIAYYAKTYNRGKTYSNSVPVHVANYHDLKRVMDDKVNHLHVDYDRTRLKRDSKIYINDYSGSSQNGLDLFKDFYNLSVGTSLTGHTPLNISTEEGTNMYDRQTYQRGVKTGQNLEFFLRTDIDHTGSPWTSIGTDDVCFKGTFHGDGHTISGLDNSLFYNLCGDVYNLGVTGSFNTAGVVDKGNGYVESCWTSTEGTPDGSVYAVFGAPKRTTEEIAAHGEVQLVNSYYQEGKTYKTTAAAHGVAKTKPAKAYYNGELAYDLNNFYLYKRYSDHEVTSGNENQRYSYFAIGNDDKLTLQNNHYYNPNADHCSTGLVDDKSNVIMYVEDRFADGDYRYAAGEIPTSEDERFHSWTVMENGNETVKSGFFPIWPDDYIFFGQKLTYGYVKSHQNVPTAVARKGIGRLSYGDDANRVYRAPAYYGSKVMGVAHFNPMAYLAQKSSDGTKEAYPGMTAIDFAGHNDTTWGMGSPAGSPAFYPPLLDDDGLTGIVNVDETKNLLVYAPAASGTSGYVNAKTHGVLTHIFEDPKYNTYYDNTDGYKLVTDATPAISTIYGHLVQSDLTATNDHLLVDKQDFNCPIDYHFDNDHLMWYQRTPEDQEYVDLTKGWQGISIPFTAELVTTNEKGEITHFYSGSEERQKNIKGHEYWLREFNGATEETVIEKTEEAEIEKKVAKATFLYPTATGDDKTVTNTFLWDYYYKNELVHNQKDYNSDTYLEYRHYYDSQRTYYNYPLLKAATPYIIGLPGDTYYEFDLSGEFEAQNTRVSIPKLTQQVITFASNTGITIEVSDDEDRDVTNVTKTLEGTNKNFTFTFHRNYCTQNLGMTAYVLSADGSRYDKVTAEGGSTVSGGATTIPFRPYFTASSVAKPAGARQMMPEYIYFGGDFSGLEEEPTPTLNGGLEIYAKDHKIITTSHLKDPVVVSIVNVSGITYANYLLQPGETKETRVNNAGVYIVNRKKLLVR